MAEWQDYMAQADEGEHTVTGTLKVLRDVWSPQLENARDLLVYLPPDYDAGGRRYPVIYAHDGQNLFDQATSYAGEWQVDEVMEELSREGRPAIVVGVPNMGLLRVAEYTPFEDREAGGGQGELYVTFLVETVKPLIDAAFRTLPDREHTGVMGSSLGALISLYALFRFPGVFGFGLIFSPALDHADGAIYGYVADSAATTGPIYMDVGTREAWGLIDDAGRREEFSVWFLDAVRRMRDILLKRGYVPGANLYYLEAEGAIHHESAWSSRLPDALRFALPQ